MLGHSEELGQQAKFANRAILLEKRSMARPHPQLRDHPVEPDFASGGLVVIESHHSPGFSMDWRTEAYPKVLVVLGGAGSLDLRNRALPLGKATLAVVPPGVKHRVEDSPNKPLSLYVLCLQSWQFPGRDITKRLFANPISIRNPLLAGQAILLLRQILYESRRSSPDSDTLTLCLTAQLLVGLDRAMDAASSAGVTAASRVAQYVRELEHAFWTKESMNEVARRLGLSRRHFSSLFRQQTGRSWLEQLHQLRTRHAAHLLESSSAPVKSVAFECGYDDLSHFYRRFQKAHGISPAAWRRANQVPIGQSGRSLRKPGAFPPANCS